MLKKMTMLAMASAAIAAFAVPATASANWTHDHIDIPSGQDPHILLEGTWGFEAEVGDVTCHETTFTLQLTGGTTDSHLKSMAFHNPTTKCTATGLLATICGENSFTGGELTGEPTGTITGAKAIDIEGIVLHTNFGECLSLTLSGDLTAEVDKGESMGNLSLEGTLDTGGFGEVEVDGNLTITPEGTYGIHFGL
jgi:hypothetical protein